MAKTRFAVWFRSYLGWGVLARNAGYSEERKAGHEMGVISWAAMPMNAQIIDPVSPARIEICGPLVYS